jgi:hypothetical protein
MRKFACLVAVSFLAGATSWLPAGNANPKSEMQQKLREQFVLVKLTADKKDVVEAGSVLAFHKDGMTMCSVNILLPPTRFYHDGEIHEPLAGDMVWNLNLGRVQPGVNSATVPKRNFTAGDKVWLSDITVRNEGVTLRFYSDPYDGVRYYGDLVFPFNKKSMPSPEEMLKTIAEVVTVDSANNSSSATATASAEPPASPPAQETQAQPLPAIAPPPPPPDAPPAQPKTISKGQTRDQVVAIMGQPQKVVNLGTKEIDYYPDMKVIFINGKVADVQ